MTARLSRYIHTAIEDARYQNLGVLAWDVCRKLVSPVVTLNCQFLFEIDLDTVQLRYARIDCNIAQAVETDLDEIVDMEIRPPEPSATWSDEDEHAAALQQLRRASLREKYLRALRAGESCFVARVGAEMAHSNWIRYDDSGPLVQRPVLLMRGEIYTTDGFTAERYRGLRVHEAVLTTMLMYARRRGYKRAYTITDLAKAASRRALRRVGWKLRGGLLFVTPRLLRRSWVVRLVGDPQPIIRAVRASMVAHF